MSGVVIVLIIIGLVFIFGSFILTSKLDQEKSQEEKESDVVSNELIEQKTNQIKEAIDKYVEENVDSRLSDIEAKFSEIVNNKTLALGDYAVSVNEEIERNHNEVMFLYSMLNDKQKEIMTVANLVDDYRKEVEAFVNSNDIAAVPAAKEEVKLEEEIKDIDDSILEEPSEEISEVDSSRDVILEMHKSGLSILEIAKHLGLGVGEVKLVVDLYQGGSK